jgi:hypothetical protein
MTFFNPKEEVLDIKLTQYGRHLLSKGKMKPVYYAFFDEGVLYDAASAGITETKNSAETRIQDETTTMKTQHCFTGRDEFLFDGIGEEAFDEDENRAEIGIYVRLHTLTDPLGTTELGSTKMPFFTMTMLDGEIDGTKTTQTGSARTSNVPVGTDTYYSQQELRIPQIEIDIKYNIAVIDPTNPDVSFEIDRIVSPTTTYGDGLEVVVGTDDIMILLEEGNTICGKENFEIEVFEMTGVTGALGEEVITPMQFQKKIERVQGNLLLDEDEARKLAGLKKGEVMGLNSSCVEYFMDVQVDNEISNALVCAAISKIKSEGGTIYSPCGGIDIDCPDLELGSGIGVISADIYASDADQADC